MPYQDAVPLTKIRPPRLRSAPVPREALERRIAELLPQCRLLAMTAPAGFGKTTALVRQLGLLPPGSAQAWVSADRGEDLAGLVASLWAALACSGVHRPRPLPAGPAAGEEPKAAPSHRLALASALQNELAAAPVPCGLIVIDDAHRIADPGAWAFLDALLRRLPAPWTVVLAGRREPLLSLPWLRATGELAEIGLNDLAFAGAELAAWAARQGALGSTGPVDAVCVPLAGWAAAWVLARTGPGHRERDLQDYFATEVLGSLPEPLRAFALRAAVLHNPVPSRCDALLQRTDSAERLDELAAWGLLAGDGSPRLLPLFRQLLLAQLQREAPEEAQALLARAAQSGLEETAAPSTRSVAHPWPPIHAEPRPLAAPVPRATAAGWADRPREPRELHTRLPTSVSKADDRAALLSAREREVLARIASGDSNKLIARAFSLSPHTVKRHVANILDKLMLSSRVQAAAWHAAQQERETA